MNKIKIVFIALYFLPVAGCFKPYQERASVSLIFDTDIGPDYDDVGAITLLHAFADSNKVKILATVASSKYQHVAAVINVFNTYFHRPDIPIGVPKGNAVTDKDFQHWTDTIIARYPHSIKSNEETPDAVTVYRKVLASQPDHTVTIVTVGFLTNLANLLASPPDVVSKLTGTDLVKRKVKLLVCMAGRFPQGREYNVHRDAPASKKVFAAWPTDILLSGFEIGQKIKTGLPLIRNESISNSPVKDVFRISIPMAAEDKEGRMSWDQTAIFVAVKGVSPYFEIVPGRMVMHEDGSNSWDSTGKNHFYLVQKMPVGEMTNIINELMMHQPKK